MTWWRHWWPAVATAVMLVVVVLVVHRPSTSGRRSAPGSSTPGSRELCGPRDVAAAGDLVVQADVWGADTPQCVVTAPDGLTVTVSGHEKRAPGEPAAFPSVIAGCAAGRCSTNRALPAPVGARLPVTAAWEPGDGVWDAVLDVWLRTAGPVDGDEIEVMIWSDWADPVEPFGTPSGEVEVDGAHWSVRAGRNRRPVYTYARVGRARRFTGDLSGFLVDATARGWLPAGTWVTSVQAGFELWSGGAGSTMRDVHVG